VTLFNVERWIFVSKSFGTEMVITQAAALVTMWGSYLQVNTKPCILKSDAL
jgi:hypothetical protein